MAWADALAMMPLLLASERKLTEIANALWKLKKSDRLQGIDPQLLLIDACDLIDQIEPDRHLHQEALALAMHLDHPVYDCIYLALARREAAVLFTADRRLATLAETVLP